MKSLYYEVLTALEGDRIGQMYVHTIDTPCIQVAGDGKTAKGVWFSPGHETAQVNGKLTAMWCWSYFGTDFIKEDGEWKMWHYHCYGMFKTPFEKNWVESSMESIIPSPNIPEHLGPNKPYTYYNGYTPTSVRELVPAPPKPYETFDPSTRY